MSKIVGVPVGTVMTERNEKSLAHLLVYRTVVVVRVLRVHVLKRTSESFALLVASRS